MRTLNSTRLRRLGCLAALATAAPAAVDGQRVADLPAAGQRVRLYYPRTSRPVSAEFVRAGTDTLWVRYPGTADSAGVPRAELRELHVLRGLGPRRVGRGVGLGVLTGAAVGAAVGLMMASGDRDGASFVGGPLGAMALMAGVGAVPGAVIGGVMSTARTELWAPVPLR